MESSQSVLSTIITRARAYLDEVDVDSKYSDDFILRHYVHPSLVDITARLNLNRDDPIVNRLAYTLVDGQNDYALPPCVQKVLGFVIQDEDGRIIYDVKPEGLFSWRDKGWALEGNILSVTPLMTGEQWNVHLWYVSNGDTRPHLSTGGGELREASDGRHEFVLGTPTLGEIDRRVNGYAGQTLRLLPASPAALENRVIESSYKEGSTWVCRLRHNFDETAVGENIPYEIAPPESEAFMEAAAVNVAMKMGTPRKITQGHMAALRVQWQASMKTIGDNLSLIQSRTFKHVDKKTRDKGWGPFSE